MRKISPILAAWSLLALATAAQAGSPASEHWPGLVCQPLTGNEERLCVIHSFEGGAEWFVLGYGTLHRKLEPAPEVMMMQVAALLASPGQRYLAVLSVGEGHPALDVLDFAALLDNRAAPPVYSLNPYPHSVDVDAWLSDTRLAIEIPRLLEEDPLPAGVPACPGGRYVLAVPPGTLTCR